MTSPTLKACRWLTSRTGQTVLNNVLHDLPLQPAKILKLRQLWGIDNANAIASVASVAVEVAGKFRLCGALATNRALQQSTHIDIAKYKASHMPVGSTIVDLCCGVGGDLIAFVQRGSVIAVDSDPAVCALAAHNLRLLPDEDVSGGSSKRQTAIVCQSADMFMHNLPPDIDLDWLHIDPDRRPSGKRVSDPHYYEPAADKISAWIERFGKTLIKLAPAAELPSIWKGADCREWISHAGQCRQQLLWFSRPSEGSQSAAQIVTKATTIGSDGRIHSFSIDSPPSLEDQKASITSSPQAYLHDFDPSIRASGLSSALANAIGLQCIHSPAGFFTSPSLPSASTTHLRETLAAFVSSFEVLWFGKLDEKRLKQTIKEFSPTALEIKIRGLEGTGEQLRPENLRPRLLSKQKMRRTDEDSRVDGHLELTLLISKGFAALAKRCS